MYFAYLYVLCLGLPNLPLKCLGSWQLPVSLIVGFVFYFNATITFAIVFPFTFFTFIICTFLAITTFLTPIIISYFTCIYKTIRKGEGPNILGVVAMLCNVLYLVPFIPGQI